MIKIPIVFCFDDNILMPAGICINSLLKHANSETFYDIFILHDDKVKFPTSGYLEKLHSEYKNFSITYRSVGNAFDGAFEIRGITKATYYRLLIPEIIQEYDKIIYSDVDMIFRDDQSKIFLETDMENFYVAGVSTPYSDIEDYLRKVIKIDSSKYISAGNLIFNSKKILEDNIITKFKILAKKSWKYQDMDVINIVCRDKIKYLPPSFGVIGTISEILSNPDQKYYSKEVADYTSEFGTIHYNGAKPWKTWWAVNFDIWWEYYRKSVFFDPKFYFDFYNDKYDEYDKLSLWKRVKILVRYFKNGRKN